MFAAASASASSSRALLARSCRPSSSAGRRTILPHLATSKLGNNYCSRLYRPPHPTFSTIPFDGTTQTNASVSPESRSDGSLEPQSSSMPPEQTANAQPEVDPPSNRDFLQQIQQWMATNPKIAPYKAEEALAKLWVEQQDLFQQWEERRRQTTTSASLPTIRLTTESVNTVLQAWCNSNNGEMAARRAERLLHWMEDFHTQESEMAAWAAFLPRPNYQSYATVIDAWSRAAIFESNNPKNNDDSGGRSKGVSSATKAGFECAKRSEDVLMHMQRMHEQQTELAKNDGRTELWYKSEIQPDTRVFNLVLKAWSKIKGGNKASATRAMRILDLMQELFHYQSKSASEWQGVILSNVQPNVETYKLVLHAYANATHTVEGPDRAEEILRHMLSISKAGNLGAEIMPDIECFHIVMKAHAESVRKKRKGDDGLPPAERAQKVAALLDWMEILGQRSTSKIHPTTESYRIALSAWVWSHNIDAPKEAKNILHRMIRAYNINSRNSATANNDSLSSVVKPETRDFNTVINCCSFARKVGTNSSEEDDESLLQRQLAHQEIYDIARGALDEILLSQYAQPDEATFAGMIRAALNLLPNHDDRDVIVIDLFRLAFQTTPSGAPSPRIKSTASERTRAPPGAGCVDANVLRQLRHALPSTEDYIRVREEFEQHRRGNFG